MGFPNAGEHGDMESGDSKYSAFDSDLSSLVLDLAG
uniref:Uncharacterized protein n=1 Tax=Arundo donax TaxID=35708 RepID=A0A0A9GK20_ARUDO